MPNAISIGNGVKVLRYFSGDLILLILPILPPGQKTDEQKQSEKQIEEQQYNGRRLGTEYAFARTDFEQGFLRLFGIVVDPNAFTLGVGLDETHGLGAFGRVHDSLTARVVSTPTRAAVH